MAKMTLHFSDFGQPNKTLTLRDGPNVEVSRFGQTFLNFETLNV